MVQSSNLSEECDTVIVIESVELTRMCIALICPYLYSIRICGKQIEALCIHVFTVCMYQLDRIFTHAINYYDGQIISIHSRYR